MMLVKIDGVLQKIEKTKIICSWLTTLFVTFMIVLDILLRFLFNHPLPASWEISEVLMPYIVIFGFAYTLTKNFHIRVSIITDHLPSKVQFSCRAFANVISFIMCVMLSYWSWLRFWESFMIKEEILAPISIPWWFGKLAMPMAFGTFGARYIMDLILDIKRKS